MVGGEWGCIQNFKKPYRHACVVGFSTIGSADCVKGSIEPLSFVSGGGRGAVLFQGEPDARGSGHGHQLSFRCRYNLVGLSMTLEDSGQYTRISEFVKRSTQTW